MKEFYEFTQELPSNAVGANSKITLQKTTELLQQLANDNAEHSGYGFEGLLSRANAYWVISKIRVVFEKMPYHREKTVCKTWPVKPNKITLERDFEIKDVNGNLLISATSEWCMIDAETRRICRIHGDTVMPGIDYIEERAAAGEYTKQKFNVDECDFCFDRVIRSSDIDMNGHTNNTKYSLMAADCFTTDFLKEHDFKSFEIHFLKESFEGETLSVYKKQLSDSLFFVMAVNSDNQVVFRTFLEFEQ